MIGELPLIYWDACIFLSYINGIPERLQHIQPMMRLSGKDFQIITSVLSITEVAFGLAEQGYRELNPETEKRIDELWLPGSPIDVVEFHALLAHDAKHLMRAAMVNGWSLKPADAIHLATANRFRVTDFHTYDDRLDKYSETTPHKFRVGRPLAVQPDLAGVNEGTASAAGANPPNPIG